MEDSLGKSKQVERIFLTKEFEKICPFYMSIGMTYKEFWLEDVELTKYYLKAYRLKEKRKAEEIEWTVWEQGLYIYEAISNLSPILRPFSKGKPLPYPEKPHFLGEEEIQREKEQQEKEKEKQKEIAIMRAQIFFENWARSTKKHFEGE